MTSDKVEQLGASTSNRDAKEPQTQQVMGPESVESEADGFPGVLRSGVGNSAGGVNSMSLSLMDKILKGKDVPMFSGSVANFFTWSSKLKEYLRVRGLWELVKQTLPENSHVSVLYDLSNHLSSEIFLSGQKENLHVGTDEAILCRWRSLPENCGSCCTESTMRQLQPVGVVCRRSRNR